VTDIHPDHFDPTAIATLRKSGAPVVIPPAVAAMEKIPDPIVMGNRQMRANELAPAGITVISVPAYNIQRGPAPGQLYHPRERGQGYLLTIGDKLVYVAGDTECVPAMEVMLGALSRRGLHADESAVHDAAGRGSGMREGFGRRSPSVSLHGQKPEEFAAALKGNRSRSAFSTGTRKPNRQIVAIRRGRPSF